MGQANHYVKWYYKIAQQAVAEQPHLYPIAKEENIARVIPVFLPIA